MTLEVGKKYHVIVINIVKSGIVVQLDDGSTALIHISRISDKFVADIREFVNIRDEFEALGVEGLSRPVELSLRHLNLRRNVNRDNRNDEVDNKQANRAKKPTAKYTSRKSRKYSAVDPDDLFPSRRSTGQSLDDMIAASQKDLKDKIGHEPKPRSRPRRNGKE